jgi:hypothetical protein
MTRYDVETAAASIPATTLKDLVERTNALKNKTFETEISLKITIKGNLVSVDGAPEVENLEVTVNPLQEQGNEGALKAIIQDTLQEAIVEDFTQIPFVEEPARAMEAETEAIAQAVEDLEAEHDMYVGDLLEQLEAKTGVALS